MLTHHQASQFADALKVLPADSGVWPGLLLWLDDTITDANDLATDLKTPEAERAWWSGHERALRDLRRDLALLRSGDARQWSHLAQPPARAEDEEEAAEE